MTARHFGNPIGGTASLGASTDDPSRGDTLPLTSVLTGRSLIEPYKFTDTLRDRIALCFVCMVVCSIAVLFGVFVYIGFFFRA